MSRRGAEGFTPPSGRHENRSSRYTFHMAPHRGVVLPR